jgi:hypothetical protein
MQNMAVPESVHRVASSASAVAGAMEDAISHGRQISLERQYSPLERVGADESSSGVLLGPSSGVLLGPLPPPQAMLEVPVRRVGSTLYAERRLAREYVLKASPVLFHTESWLETLLTPREWMPPPVLFFVVVIVRSAAAHARAPTKRIARSLRARECWILTRMSPFGHASLLTGRARDLGSDPIPGPDLRRRPDARDDDRLHLAPHRLPHEPGVRALVGGTHALGLDRQLHAQPRL